jgi:hypothetical protein
MDRHGTNNSDVISIGRETVEQIPLGDGTPNNWLVL